MYLETFSNFSIKAPVPLFKEEVHQKMKLVKFFTTQKIILEYFHFCSKVFLDIVTHYG